jgi:hypothetical protein
MCLILLVRKNVYISKRGYINGEEEKNMVSRRNLPFDGTWSTAASYISG